MKLLKDKDKPKKERGHSCAWWRKKCDKKMQEVGQRLFPRSILSGNPTQVMHHFVPKSVSARLRYDWDNLIPLTNAEHMRLHQSGDPDYEHQIIQKKGVEWYENLRKRGREIIKINVSYYKEVLRELEEN